MEQSSSFTRNLLIVQTERDQDPSDWIAVKQRIERDAPDIEVRIAENRYRPSAVEAEQVGIARHRQRLAEAAAWQVQRPSLVFSPIRLIDYVPRGGAVYCGQPLGKDEQSRRLSSLGIPTPKGEVYSRGASFSRKEWGKYVVIKPVNLNSGKGIRLVRTVDLAARYDELTSKYNDQYLVEQYIDSEDGYPAEYRVLSLFGRALWCTRSGWNEKRRPLAEIAVDPQGIIASNADEMMAGKRVRAVCHDPEIIALGERAHQAFPECPVIGVDIVKENESGRLYVLEANPHGSVWHMSSRVARRFGPELVSQLYAQFNALDLIADLLIQKTRSEAR